MPYCPNLRPMSFIQKRRLLAEFIGWLAPRVIHIHSLAGFDWQATTSFFDFVTDSGLPYYFTLHDYSVICHRNDLVQTNGRYCGLPGIDSCRACVAGDRSYPEAIDPAVRRQTFARFLKGATGVFAPSHDIKKRLEAAGADYAIEVRPHDEALVEAPVLIPARNMAPVNIVTLGAIGPHKGSQIIRNLARDAKSRALPVRYHIVGYSDSPTETEAAGVTETGRYATTADAFARVAAASPACIFLPSIWPETHCYALSMAFALRCPPVVFDIGAQADRVRQAGFGFVLPYELIDHIVALNDRLIALASQLAAGLEMRCLISTSAQKTHSFGLCWWWIGG